MKGLYFGARLWLVDLVLAATATLVFGWLVGRDSSPVLEMLCKDGTGLYGAFLSALAALLGFAIAAVAIIANLVTGRAFAGLRKSGEYTNFWKAFTWTIRALAIANAASFLALFVNRYSAFQFWCMIIVMFTIFEAALSLGRSGYTLEVVLERTKNVGLAKTETMDQYEKA